jgi:hypothetical protein
MANSLHDEGEERLSAQRDSGHLLFVVRGPQPGIAGFFTPRLHLAQSAR